MVSFPTIFCVRRAIKQLQFDAIVQNFSNKIVSKHQNWFFFCFAVVVACLRFKFCVQKTKNKKEFKCQQPLLKSFSGGDFLVPILDLFVLCAGLSKQNSGKNVIFIPRAVITFYHDFQLNFMLSPLARDAGKKLCVFTFCRCGVDIFRCKRIKSVLSRHRTQARQKCEQKKTFIFFHPWFDFDWYYQCAQKHRTHPNKKLI